MESMGSVDSADNGLTWSSWIGGVTIGLASGIVITIVIAVVAVAFVIKKRMPANGNNTGSYKV